MKYIVASAATLSLAGGSTFTLEKGIHDSKSFSDDVKKHWAFSSYARPVDEADLDADSDSGDLAARITALEGEVSTLTAQITEKDKTITSLEGEVSTLTAQITEKDKTITSLEGEVSTLTAQLAAAQNPENLPSDSGDNSGSPDGAKNNGKKQPASE
ncbi:ELKS/Rab6-interacting/CAST family protein [Pantoea ananatis]|uniref:STY1053 family phage-associated protein n=1 Tax=Pantoea ananas TaxID=553 RepID=UPI001FF6EFB2|nr:ELKS/Rab6-interacting/CAST family protein [Pantoea ananatis]MCK0554468.1 ELKS/Rab6-interacting/CAST family protein [Pantoea ananatis]